MQGEPDRRLLVEGVVIVLSILLAFAIDAAWEYRGDRSRERELLSSLAQEYRTNRTTLQQTIGFVEQDLELMRSFFSSDPANLVDLDHPSLGNFWAALYRPQTFELASGATSAALSSGNLDLIRDPQVRELIAGWPARTDDIQERAGVMVGFEQAWYDFVAQHPTAQRSLGQIGAADRDRDVAWIPGDDMVGVLGALWQDDEARARAMMRGSAAEIYVIQLGELVARVDSTLALLTVD